MAGYCDLLDSDHSSSGISVARLENLPVELLVEILSYLDTRQDLVTCCEVSKLFNAAANSQLLWKALCGKVWRLFKCRDDDWKGSYVHMYNDWSRYEQCYAAIRMAWDRLETFAAKYCPSILQGLSPGATEKDLNEAEMRNLNGQ